MIKSELKHWVDETLGTQQYQISALQGDASFRCYYRAHLADKTYIVMLAPPDKEKTDAFVAIAKSWQTHGLSVPTVLAWQQQAGFALLSDFGDTLLLDVLNEQTADSYYAMAMQSLLPLQVANSLEYPLQPFDAAYMRQELSLFNEWFLKKLLKISLSEQEETLLQEVCNHLIVVGQSQPQTVIHRDYHSRNLMVLPDSRLGIIDFQDAMIGPITYDLVSLLKDCYIAWPLEKVQDWARRFYQALQEQGRLKNSSFAEFIEWFDYVGLQRHLKVLGIFSRLKLRDNKAQYLNDIPRIIDYVLAVTQRYPFLAEFDVWFRQCVLPMLTLALAEHAAPSESKVA